MDATHSLHYREHSNVSHANPVPSRRRIDADRDLPERHDDLLPARSVVIAVAIGAGLWAVILTAGWLIFR